MGLSKTSNQSFFYFMKGTSQQNHERASVVE